MSAAYEPARLRHTIEATAIAPRPKFASATYVYYEGANVFTPDWWITLNNAQKAAPGGRQDDWPAQHDQAVMFVPPLTPELVSIAKPPLIAPPASVGTTNFRIVGVGSTGGPNRVHMATALGRRRYRRAK